MVDYKDMDAFINYNYTPFSKSQCVRRLVLVWILSVLICCIGKHNVLFLAFLGAIGLLVSVVFIFLIFKWPKSKESRYLCDGIFWYYSSALMNMTAYRVITLQIGQHPLLFVALLLLLHVCICVFLLVTFSNIKRGKYVAEAKSKGGISLPLLGGIGGVLAASLFLRNQVEQTAWPLIAFVLLLLSFMMSIGSINLLKVRLNRLLNSTDRTI